jgi:hypothetical protein
MGRKKNFRCTDSRVEQFRNNLLHSISQKSREPLTGGPSIYSGVDRQHDSNNSSSTTFAAPDCNENVPNSNSVSTDTAASKTIGIPNILQVAVAPVLIEVEDVEADYGEENHSYQEDIGASLDNGLNSKLSEEQMLLAALAYNSQQDNLIDHEPASSDTSTVDSGDKVPLLISRPAGARQPDIHIR